MLGQLSGFYVLYLELHRQCNLGKACRPTHDVRLPRLAIVNLQSIWHLIKLFLPGLLLLRLLCLPLIEPLCEKSLEVWIRSLTAARTPRGRFHCSRCCSLTSASFSSV